MINQLQLIFSKKNVGFDLEMAQTSEHGYKRSKRSRRSRRRRTGGKQKQKQKLKQDVEQVDMVVR